MLQEVTGQNFTIVIIVFLAVVWLLGRNTGGGDKGGPGKNEGGKK